MEPLTVMRRLTCILAADAVGYSRMMSEDEAGTLRVLAAHRAVIDGIIAFHHGRIVATAGDSVLAEFGSVVEAVRCAVEIQEALKTRNDALPQDHRLHYRVGVNLGDVVVKGEDLLGDGVNVAARLEGIAEPGGVCIASSVYDQITGKLDLRFVDIGEQHLKNISRPVRVYKIATRVSAARADAGPAGSPPALRWAAAFGVAALVTLAVAWQAGWLDGRAAREEAAKLAEAKAAAAASAEEARSQTAKASEQARALVDEAKRHAEAEAELTRARAKAEADAMRAKAELEARNLRAKAEAEAAARAKSEADAMRAKAELEARNLRAKAEAEAAARAQADKARAEQAKPPAAASQAKTTVPAAVAAPTPSARPASGYDGEWLVSRQLDAFEEAMATGSSARIRVRDGEFVIDSGVRDQANWMHMTGRPGQDGTLVLTGNGISGLKNYYGKPYGIRFEGRCDIDRCMLAGKYGTRPGTITLVRLGG